jgi:predicted amidohydrolase YtcJ
VEADVVFTGGSVFTGGRSVRSGVAVAGGRIVAVAPDEELRDLVGRGTDVVDLAGGLLTPGFQDAHVHPVFAGALMLLCNLEGSATSRTPWGGWPRTRRRTPSGSGSAAAAGRWRPSPAGGRTGRCSTPSSRTGRCT